MNDMLALASHLPEVAFAAGDVVVREGGEPGGIWVLVSGTLAISKAGVPINVLSRPGTLIGEVSALLGANYTATVTAQERCVMRHAADGPALLARDPAITRLVAIGLAERLNFVTTYLADLKQQYADAPGLAMVSDVLGRLAQRQGPVARPGSARDADPDY